MTVVLDAEPEATAEVRHTLRDPRRTASWLDGGIICQPPYAGTVHSRLVEALLRRTTTFDEIADEAVAVASSVRTPAGLGDCDLILARAFPAGSGADGTRTEAQRRFLAALLANDGWRDDSYTVGTQFRQAGPRTPGTRCARSSTGVLASPTVHLTLPRRVVSRRARRVVSRRALIRKVPVVPSFGRSSDHSSTAWSSPNATTYSRLLVKTSVTRAVTNWPWR